MIYLISLILIFIESTMATKIFSLVVTFSFVSFLSTKNYKIGLINILILSEIFSLQNHNFFKYFFVFGLIYLVFHLVFTQFLYSTENIIIFTVVQTVIFFVFFRKNIGWIGMGFNAIGLLISNYIFIKLSRRKEK